MSTLTDVAANSRKYLRDFGTFFEINFDTVNAQTLRMQHPLVAAASVEVIDIATVLPVPATDYEVNERHGLIRLKNNPSTYSRGLKVSGIYYQWFLDEDLVFFATVLLAEHGWHTRGFIPNETVGVEVEVMSIGTLVQALWSLTTEFSTDVDVNTPEGISIPAHQRFNQVYQLMAYWQAQYDEKAAMLNVGLKKIEVLNLRRISRLTNRYPPMYRTREVDDPRPPVRVRPYIDSISPTPYEQEEEYWQLQYQDPSEVFDLDDGGWFSIGSNGQIP